MQVGNSGCLNIDTDGWILAVSPHPDDIALSCGGFLRTLKSARISLISCFTLSIYAPLAAEGDLTPAAVQKIRRAEDEEYASRIGAERLDLGLPDVTLRYADSDLWLNEQPQRDEAYHGFNQALINAVMARPYTHVLCPLAIGHNVDHVFAYWVIREWSVLVPRLIFYEDLPYGARVGGPAFVRDYVSERAFGMSPISIDVTDVFPQKLADIGVYTSQIYPEDLEGVIVYGQEVAGWQGFSERFWLQPENR